MMLANFHHAANRVLERQQNKWQLINNAEMVDIDQLYQEGVRKLNFWLDQLESFHTKWAKVRDNLYNLCILKARLESQPWRLPEGNHTEMTFFKHDLLFYLMINGLVHQSCNCFKSFCDPYEFPSASFQYPKLDIPQKRLIQLLREEASIGSWVWHVLQYPTPAYQKVLSQLQQWHAQLTPSEPTCSFMQPLLIQLSVPPNRAWEEQRWLRIMEQLYSSTKDHPDKLTWPAIREVLALIVRYGPVQVLSVDTFCRLFEQVQLNQTSLRKEIDFWRLQSTMVPWPDQHDNPGAKGVFQAIISYLEELEKRSLQDEYGKFHKVKAVFNESPEAFARLFHQAISRGLFSVNKAVDVGSVLEFLLAHFTIYKKNGGGEVRFNTLLTYFKRMNSGDM